MFGVPEKVEDVSDVQDVDEVSKVGVWCQSAMNLDKTPIAWHEIVPSLICRF